MRDFKLVFVFILLVGCSNIDTVKHKSAVEPGDLLTMSNCSEIDGGYAVLGTNYYSDEACYLPVTEFGYPAPSTDGYAYIGIPYLKSDWVCEGNWLKIQTSMNDEERSFASYESDTMQLAKLANGDLIIHSQTFTASASLYNAPIYIDKDKWCRYRHVDLEG